MAPSLTDLPCELLIEIFKFQDQIHQAVKLSRTCRLFRVTWTSNARIIVDKVLAKEASTHNSARFAKFLANKSKLESLRKLESSRKLYEISMGYTKRVLTTERVLRRSTYGVKFMAAAASRKRCSKWNISAP